MKAAVVTEDAAGVYGPQYDHRYSDVRREVKRIPKP